VLIAGAHRLKACHRLGWSFIPAIFHDNDTAIDREMWEIDENLIRAELTPAEEADHLKRRKELWERRQAEIRVAQVAPPEFGYKKPPPAEKGFAADTADATGKSKATINRSIARADKIAPDVLRVIAGTDLDTGSSLDKIARLPVEQRT
jgi:hypothetical protein